MDFLTKRSEAKKPGHIESVQRSQMGNGNHQTYQDNSYRSFMGAEVKKTPSNWSLSGPSVSISLRKPGTILSLSSGNWKLPVPGGLPVQKFISQCLGLLITIQLAPRVKSHTDFSSKHQPREAQLRSLRTELSPFLVASSPIRTNVGSLSFFQITIQLNLKVSGFEHHLSNTQISNSSRQNVLLQWVGSGRRKNHIGRCNSECCQWPSATVRTHPVQSYGHAADRRNSRTTCTKHQLIGYEAPLQPL